MVAFRSLIISTFLLISLLTIIDGSRYLSVRQKRADECPNLNGNACLFVNCENGGECFEDPTTLDCFKCQCAPGYTGKVCDTPIAILPTGCNPGCQNGGLCNVNVCQCFVGYTGTLCEITDFCLPNNPCQNGGQCTSTGASYICDCTGTGYTGTICTELIPINPCTTSPCQNGGQCSWNGETMNCLCVNGYAGTFCQIPPIPCATTPCENGGKCELLATNTYGCVCPEEFTGTRCETSILVTHPCVTMPLTVCLNGGVCTMNSVNYVCKCAVGWSGTNCQIKERTSSCNPNICGVHGTCFEINPPIGPTVFCNCENQWTGRYCDVNMDVNCPDGFCLSGGVCRMNGNIPYCDCPPLYTGERCESLIDAVTTTSITTTTLPITITVTNVVGVCSPNPCYNEGACYPSTTSFMCICKPPFTGTLCETILTTIPSPFTTPGVSMACTDQPCKNGGTCVPVGTSYSCFCGLTSIYTGKNCDSTTPMTTNECPLDCAPGRCIFSGNPSKPYACLWNGIMRPTDGTTG